MNKMNAWLFMIMTYMMIMIMIIIIILFFTWKQEGYENSVETMYFQNFNRPLDMVMRHYYRNKEPSFIRSDVKRYVEQVKKGRRWLSNKTLVITGLIRDCQDNVNQLESFFETISAVCKKAIFLIVENDSKDDTRKRLLEWSDRNANVVVLCDSQSINERECHTDDTPYDASDKTPSFHRIEKMAQLRNVYLSFIQQMRDMPDYVLVMDLDLKGELFLDGVFHSVFCMEKRKTIDAIACNGLMIASCSLSPTSLTYYDSFAYVQPGEEGEWNTLFDKRSHDDDVIRYTSIRYLEGSRDLDRVTSAFGGACLYRTSSLRGAKYMSSKIKYVCEHTLLHKNFREMYVNPRMIFIIEQNLK